MQFLYFCKFCINFVILYIMYIPVVYVNDQYSRARAAKSARNRDGETVRRDA